MGNDLSCINSTLQISPSATATASIARHRSRPLITIVSPSDGRACRFKEPLNVGELMLEMPGHFVAEFGHEHDGYMLRSRRISALPADRNLHAFHVYYLLPMHRMNTHLATHELHKIVLATRLDPAYSTTPYAHMHNSKINPLPSVQCEEAVMRNTKKRHAAHRRGMPHRDRRQPVRAGRAYYRYQVMEKDKLQRDQVDKGGGRGDEQAELGLRCTSKPRNWVPKLDTIMELNLEP